MLAAKYEATVLRCRYLKWYSSRKPSVRSFQLAFTSMIVAACNTIDSSFSEVSRLSSLSPSQSPTLIGAAAWSAVTQMIPCRSSQWTGVRPSRVHGVDENAEASLTALSSPSRWYDHP